MTTDLNRSVGASSAKHRHWKPHWDRLRQEASRLQMRIAKALRNRSWIAGSPRQRLILERLEPCEGKLSRTVLRGVWAGDRSRLPGPRLRARPVRRSGLHCAR
jgi:hypothetical protein